MPPGETSRSAYRQAVLDGKPPKQRDRILAFIRHAGVPVSRAQIEHAFSPSYHVARLATGSGRPVDVVGGTWDGGPPIPLASICGRVNAVLEDPERRDGLTRPHPSTGHRDPAFLRVAYRAKGERGSEVEFILPIDPAPVQRTFAFVEVAAMSLQPGPGRDD